MYYIVFYWYYGNKCFQQFDSEDKAKQYIKDVLFNKNIIGIRTIKEPLNY